MKNLIRLAGAFAAGYLLTWHVLPFIVAKAEAWDLDDAWDVFNTEAD